MTRLAWLLKDLPAEVLGRLRSDRVLYLPVPPGAGGRAGPPGTDQSCARGPGDLARTAGHHQHRNLPVRHRRRRRVGPADPRLPHRAAWLGHDGETLIRLAVDHRPGHRDPKPVWLWSSRTGATPADVDQLWQAFLRRFDIEHTFRFFKQVLGWNAPKLRAPAAADRWTWLIIAAHAQLRLARTLAADLRLPWQRPAPDGRLTPARVRRGFRNIRTTAGCPAGAPKPGKPGPGRPPGSKNRRPAPSYDVGRTIKRQLTLKTRPEQEG